MSPNPYHDPPCPRCDGEAAARRIRLEIGAILEEYGVDLLAVTDVFLCNRVADRFLDLCQEEVEVACERDGGKLCLGCLEDRGDD